MISNTTPIYYKESVGRKEKILVLCVDVDNDIGKVGLKTPIIGRSEVLHAAVQFALTKPEDTDANALFTAINIYDSMVKEGRNVEIAVVAGDENSSVRAGMKIRSELLHIKDITHVDSVILVTDGAEDELVIPVIESILPIISIKRVVVEQIRGVEETYILIGRYLKKIIEEPRFSRIFLGVPGIILISLAILYVFNLLQHAFIVTLFIIGLTMFVRGFSIDRRVAAWWEESPIIFASTLLAALSIMIGLILNFTYPAETFTPKILGQRIKLVMPFIMFSIAVLLGGKAASKTLKKDIKLWHEVVGFIFLIFLYKLLASISNLLESLPTYFTLEDVWNLLFTKGILHWFALMMIVITVLTAVFMFIEREILREARRIRSLRRMSLRIKLKKLRRHRA